MALLRASHQVQAPDLTGYGQTPLLAEQPWSLGAEVQQLLPGLTTKPSIECDVIGHSYGGAVALHLARTQQLAVRKLVLFEPVAFHLLPQLPDAGQLWQEVNLLAEALPALAPRQAAMRFLDYWQQDGFFAGLPERMQQLLAAQVGKVTLDFQALSQEAATFADYAASISCPVLLLSGRFSRAPAQRLCAALADCLPNAELVLLDCGHMGPVTDPQLINPLIAEFLQG